MVVLAKTDDNWVEQEMKYLSLGEKRLQERVVKIIQDFSQNPTGSIPEFCGDWATTKATYEFCKNPVGARDRIVTAQKEATLNRMQGQPLVLILQDTTSFDFTTHTATEGLGPLENSNSHFRTSVLPSGGS